jgi:clan AA aspartic protease
LEITGNIDGTNQLWTKLDVIGMNGNSKIDAIIDTGFTGELQLPIKTAVQIGLTLAGTGRAILADGSKIDQLLFSGTIVWGTTTKDVTISIADSNEALIGGGLLHGYDLIISFSKKILTIKEPDIDIPSV